MIGQTNLKEQIDNHIKNGKFSRFTIIQGEEGSGKHELVKYIHKRFLEVNSDIVLYEAENSVEAVRKTITDAYNSVGTQIIYVFYNADNMSVSAKNALLKITEEPPKNAYFIMTISNTAKIMDTLFSRANVYTMEPYKNNELFDYTKMNFPGEEYSGVSVICTTPGEIKEVECVCNGNSAELIKFVEAIVDSLANVTIANAFKIANRIALKDTDTDKYSLKTVLHAVSYVIVTRVATGNTLKRDLDKWVEVLKFTTECASTLERTPAVNKEAILDLWILDFKSKMEQEV